MTARPPGESANSFTRYLRAKRSVDDRALDRRVWEVLAAELALRAGPAGSLDVLEVGAGSGAMIERLVDGGLVRRGRYTAVDADPRALADARRLLPAWAAGAGIGAAEREGRIELEVEPGEARVTVELVAADLFDVLPPSRSDAPSAAPGVRPRRGRDLVVAHAVLDILDLDTVLPRLLAAVAPGGLCYFPITFDGATVFEPEIDPELDRRIEELYHRTMDRRTVDGRACGSSRTGRRLLAKLPDAGCRLLATGASDWVVVPDPDEADGYPGDEAHFLHYLLETVERALAGHPELDAERFAAWVARRRRQIDDGTLVFIAHQLDVLGRTAVSASPPRSERAPVSRPT